MKLYAVPLILMLAVASCVTDEADWEYKVVSVSDLLGGEDARDRIDAVGALSSNLEAAINRVAAEGWELVSVDAGAMYFKRRPR